MAKYSLSIDQANQQYIRFRVDFTAVTENAVIHLPRWRPGRYELGNFAKNVKGFRVFNAEGKNCQIEKIGSSSWKVSNTEGEDLRVEYGYFAAELNAGSTFLSGDQLYSNPVNCFIYLDGRMEESCEVNLDIPDAWNIATSMKREGKKLVAADFHELADSPFICSADLQYNSMK